MDIKQIILFILGAPVRHALTAFGTLLMGIGATADGAATVVNTGFEFAIGLISVIAGLGLSYITKYMALSSMPPGSDSD